MLSSNLPSAEQGSIELLAEVDWQLEWHGRGVESESRDQCLLRGWTAQDLL